MIIDKILDRFDGCSFNAKQFSEDIMDYANIFHFEDMKQDWVKANTNDKIRKILNGYIEKQGYNPCIACYIDSVDWQHSHKASNCLENLTPQQRALFLAAFRWGFGDYDKNDNELWQIIQYNDINTTFVTNLIECYIKVAKQNFAVLV